MVRLKDFRRVLLVKYGSVSDSYTTSLRLRLLFAFHDQLDIMFAIFQIEDMIDIIAFMLLPAIVIVAIYRTVENTINVNISLSSITDPLAAYRYAGSVEIETEFIACMVAENNIAIGLPVAFGHACAVLANYETPVENSIGKGHFQLQRGRFLGLEFYMVIFHLAATTDDIGLDIGHCPVNGFSQCEICKDEESILHVVQHRPIFSRQTVVALHYAQYAQCRRRIAI